MAQNDTHVALIILTTQMWGGGGGNYWWKKLFRAKFCVPVRLAPTSVLTQNKGPDTEPHFSNPPPSSFGGRSCRPPPPPPQSNFQVATPFGDFFLVNNGRFFGPYQMLITVTCDRPVVSFNSSEGSVVLAKIGALGDPHRSGRGCACHAAQRNTRSEHTLRPHQKIAWRDRGVA